MYATDDTSKLPQVPTAAAFELGGGAHAELAARSTDRRQHSMLLHAMPHSLAYTAVRLNE